MWIKLIRSPLVSVFTLLSNSTHYNLQCDNLEEKVEKLIVGNSYDFNAVVSTGPDRAREVPSPKPGNNIRRLMRDTHSIDTCFVFHSDKSCANINLWAHCSVLSSYKSFAKLLQDQEKLKHLHADDHANEREAQTTLLIDSTARRVAATMQAASGATIAATETRVLVIKVNSFSLATMCALVEFLYTGNIERSIDTTQFVITHCKSFLGWYDETTGKIRDSVRWHSFDHNTPWRLKDVTWSELLDVANHYEIEDLALYCRAKVE
ncbi:hypothetical protein BGX23_009512 [Mortierella sp. AD031]|nr:hypothetical protein BGX23_009512 [Mortierella sp. AD031]